MSSTGIIHMNFFLKLSIQFLICCISFAGLILRSAFSLIRGQNIPEMVLIFNGAMQVLSVVAQQILSILRAITLGLHEFDFEGTNKYIF